LGSRDSVDQAGIETSLFREDLPKIGSADPLRSSKVENFLCRVLEQQCSDDGRHIRHMQRCPIFVGKQGYPLTLF
jgi:hypothetical protein